MCKCIHSFNSILCTFKLFQSQTVFCDIHVVFAHTQVQQSSELAQKKLQETFAALKKSINETLDTRLQLLEAQIDQLTSEARSPLVKAEEVLKAHNKTASDLLDEGIRTESS